MIDKPALHSFVRLKRGHGLIAQVTGYIDGRDDRLEVTILDQARCYDEGLLMCQIWKIKDMERVHNCASYTPL